MEFFHRAGVRAGLANSSRTIRKFFTGKAFQLNKEKLKAFYNDKNKLKQVTDYIRYHASYFEEFQQSAKAKEQEEGEERSHQREKESTSAQVETSVIDHSIFSMGSRGRQAWRRENTDVVVRIFKHFAAPPSKDNVAKAFKDDEVGRLIIRREGELRCLQKVKNEFKKRKN